MAVPGNHDRYTEAAEDFDDDDMGDDELQHAALNGDNIDEDQLFVGGSDHEFLPRLSYDIYNLRSCDPDIYQKIAALLHDMAGVEIPLFVLQILRVAKEEIQEKNFDHARRLNFEIDNRILKCVQSMHRARVCDRVRGFDSKLAKVMSVIYRHFSEGAKEVPETVIDEVVPSWPDRTFGKSVQGVMAGKMPQETMAVIKEIKEENVADSLAITPIETEPDLDAVSGVTDYHQDLEDFVSAMEFHPINSIPPPEAPATLLSFHPRQIHSSVTGETFPDHEMANTPSAVSTVRQEGVEYGLMFDVYTPEPQIFSIYMHPNMEYTKEMKQTPVDPDNGPLTEEKDPDNPGPVWMQIKRVATRITRSLRGNPKYFVTPKDLPG